MREEEVRARSRRPREKRTAPRTMYLPEAYVALIAHFGVDYFGEVDDLVMFMRKRKAFHHVVGEKDPELVRKQLQLLCDFDTTHAHVRAVCAEPRSPLAGLPALRRRALPVRVRGQLRDGAGAVQHRPAKGQG